MFNQKIPHRRKSSSRLTIDICWHGAWRHVSWSPQTVLMQMIEPT